MRIQAETIPLSLGNRVCRIRKTLGSETCPLANDTSPFVVYSCIKLGNYKEAAEYLSKRKDSGSLDVAARLALKSGDEEYSATLAEQAATEALSRADYDSAENIIGVFPQIQVCTRRSPVPIQ